VASSASPGDIYGNTPDATTRAAVDGLTSALGIVVRLQNSRLVVR
jgi:hypothetical protein